MASQRVRKPGRRTLGIAVVAALTAVGPLALSPAAQAAGTHARPLHLAAGATQETFTVPAGATGVSMSSGGAHVAVTRSPDVSPRTTINCTLTVDAPIHTSTIVYSDASIHCTAPVQEIEMVVGLYQNGSLVKDGDTMETFSSANLSANAYISYVPGSYQTGAVGTLTYPAGYTPSTQTLGEDYSTTVTL